MQLLTHHGPWLSATVLRFSGAFLAFALSSFLARYLGIENFGLYSYIIALVSIGIGFCQFGMINLCVRELSIASSGEDHGHAQAYYCSLRRLVTRLSILAGLIMLAAYYMGDRTLLNYSDLDMFMAVIAIGVVSGTALSQAALRGYRRLASGLVADTVVRPTLQLLIIAVAAFFLVESATLSLAIASFLVAALLSRLVSAYLLSHATGHLWPRTIQVETLNVQRSDVLKSAALGILLAISTSMLVLVTGRIGTPGDTAIIRVALQFALLLQVGISLSDAASAPKLAIAYRDREFGVARQTLNTSCFRAIALTFPLLLSYILLGEWLIEMSFGAEYVSAYPLLVTISTGYCLSACLGSVGTAAYSASLEIPVVTMQAILLVLAVVAMYSSYGKYGVDALAIIYAVYLVLNKVFIQILLIKHEMQGQGALK